ncbi:MAG TPA: pseudouridine synthase, partial [Flavobacteriales bacterium]|nr:pseudouridine synthase [Flavobacteriales bacterium]
KDDGGFKKKFDRDDKPRFKKDDGGFKKKFDRDDKPRFNKDDGGFKKKFDRDDKPRFKKDDGGFKKKFDRDDKPRFKKDDGDERKSKWGNKSDEGYEKKKFDRDDKPRFKKDDDKSAKNKAAFDKLGKGDEKRSSSDKKGSYASKNRSDDKSGWKKANSAYDEYMNDGYDHEAKKKSFEKGKNDYNRLLKKSEKYLDKEEKGSSDGSVRLNRYIANSGVCSRREADDLILAGAVKVNGVVVTKLGTKVNPGDKVQYGGETIKSEKNVYILLNKPKDYITTMDDPQGRKTVMSLIRGAAKERVYPVGRLDRNTTGVLLFTNDGELTRRLTHPKFLVSKMYHVEVDQNFSREDLVKMREGFELEDGFIKPDQLEFTGDSKRELGIEVHSGRNRIVRRMFEHFGYNVIKLDRVMFAGLNKKDTPRGKWRLLSEKEVGFLKML